MFSPPPPRSPYHLLRLGGMPQLQAHVRGALNMGVTDAQLTAIPEALKAAGLDAEALRCQAAIAAVKGQPQVASPSAFPLGEPNDAYAKYFIGQSYLAVLYTVRGLCNVTFEPSCRNEWLEPVGDEQYMR